jgi:hypothetical protein
VPASGGNGSISVKTARECQWTAQPEVNWLTITAGASGQGDGAVQFTAAANSDPVGRSGGVMVNGQRAPITQSAAECRFELGSSSASFAQTGGTGTADLRASSPLCTWTAVSDAEWVTITSNATGKGSTPVAFTVAPTTGAPRTGTLTIAGLHFSITQSEGCTFHVSPLTHTVDAAGGTRTINVTSGPGCPWTASSTQPWIAIASGASGSGSGTVTVEIAAASGPSRSGTVIVAGQTVAIAQGNGCAFNISPDTQSVPASGGNGSVSVTASSGCSWTAKSDVSWITVTAGASGTGNGSVTFTIASSTGPGRSGTLTIAGRTFTVNQGQGCSIALSATSASVPAAGGNGTFDVRTTDGCGWAAASNASWLTVTAGDTGSGNGTVRYAAAANTGPPRNGTITAGGHAFTVTQPAGCSYAIVPNSQAFPSTGGSGSFGVNTAGGCAWTATTSDGWISITAGGSGNGPGTVQFTAAPNTSTVRSGTITAAGQTFTVTEDSGCTAAVAPDTIAAAASGGTQNVAITTGSECSWIASSSAPWIAIPMSAASGSGSASVPLEIQANAGLARTGTATVAGRTVTVNQDSGCTVSLTPTAQSMAAGGGTGSVVVTTVDGCPWTATSNNMEWLHVTAGAGPGSGTVAFTVDPNSTGVARSGTLTIGGQMCTLTQAGS